ncbi:hypothetical protein DFH08DRAFT_619671, partial [Mycena albidolilacea]
MADMARNYHKNLQSDRMGVPREIRETKIQTVLGRTTRKATEAQKEKLQTKLTLKDIQYVVRKSASYKAPGLDGIPYELWRILEQRNESRKAEDKRGFDIVGVLHRLYNDIETHGIVKGTGFS